MQVPNAPELDAARAAAAAPGAGGGSALQNVLSQELELHAALAALVRADAALLARVLGGLAASTSELDGTAEALLAGQARPWYLLDWDCGLDLLKV